MIVHQLVDIVSKNGNLLVNIGPRSDGTIPEQVQTTLRDIGRWLAINGEAIYGTRAWTKFGEGPTAVVEGAFHDTEAKPFTAEDFRFTTKSNYLYVIELGWPTTGEAVIHSLDPMGLGSSKIAAIRVLGREGLLQYEQKSDGLHIKVPFEPPGKYAYSFRLELESTH